MLEFTKCSDVGISGCYAKEVADACGGEHGDCTPERHSGDGFRNRCSAGTGRDSAEDCEESEREQRDDNWDLGNGREECSCEWQSRAHGKCGRRGECGLGGTGGSEFGDSEFVTGVCSERVMGGEWLGDLQGERFVEPAIEVDCSEFLQFSFGRGSEFVRLAG